MASTSLASESHNHSPQNNYHSPHFPQPNEIVLLFLKKNNDMVSDSLRILIVENNLANALRIQLQLEKTGHTVIGRSDNSSDALKSIQTAPPDLILMDTDLSGDKSGIRLAKQIRFLKIPILFTTLFGCEKEFEMTRQLNMVGYLVKPIDRFSLLSILFQTKST